jgi:hypothetical protein
VLRDTYCNRQPGDPPVHIVVISDEGVDTILDSDEKGNAGDQLCTTALQQACGGGTLVLNLPSAENWKPARQLTGLGFKIHPVTDWEDLVTFARAFVREQYRD